MKTRPTLLAASLLVLLPTTAATGQESAADLESGDRIRIWASAAGLHGERAVLVETTPSDLRIRRDRAGLRVPLEQIGQLEVLRRTGERWRQGALVGGGVGAALTTAFLIPFCGDPDTVCDAGTYLRTIGLLGATSAAAGALLGLAVGEHAWVVVELDRSGASSSPVGSGAPGLAVNLELRVP